MDTYFYAEKVDLGYEKKCILQEVTFSLPKGKILTLIGPNGAGKTTLLKGISRQISPQKGVFFLDGKEINRIKRQEYPKQTAVLSTEKIYPDRMTCREVVELGRYPYTGQFGILSDEDHKIVEETMKKVKIDGFKEQEFWSCSDGQKQRVMLARVLAQEPELLILDEPTTYLDISFKQDFFHILQTYRDEKNLTVIQSLHELDLAERISDFVLCVKKDGSTEFGENGDIFQKQKIKELYALEYTGFIEEYGTMELEPQKGTPRVFVIPGDGSTVHVYRDLQRKRIPFCVGLIRKGDVEFPVAEALASEIYGLEFVEDCENSKIQQAMKAIDFCEEVICLVDSFGRHQDYNQQLLEYAKNKGKWSDGGVYSKRR